MMEPAYVGMFHVSTGNLRAGYMLCPVLLSHGFTHVCWMEMISSRSCSCVLLWVDKLHSSGVHAKSARWTICHFALFWADGRPLTCSSSGPAGSCLLCDAVFPLSVKTQALHLGSRATRNNGVGWKEGILSIALGGQLTTISGKKLFTRYFHKSQVGTPTAQIPMLASVKGHVIPFWFGCVVPRDTSDALKAIIRHFDDSFWGHSSPSFSWCVTTVEVNENTGQPSSSLEGGRVICICS